MSYKHIEDRRFYAREYAKTYYLDPVKAERRRELARKKRAEVAGFLRAVKLESGCVDCGYKFDPVALDFDHVTGVKTSNVSILKSIRAAKEEIKKCVVRCANCHRIKTYNEDYNKNLKGFTTDDDTSF